jgi:hypothetical protein
MTMKRKPSVIILFIFLLIFSCKKDIEITPETLPSATETIYPDYSNFATGNYWIYQRYTLDTSGNYTATVIDSCYIESDTVIDENKYYRYTEPYVGGGVISHLLRDSLHYILEFHRIIFSSRDFISVFKSGYQILNTGDTVCGYSSKMDDINLSVIEPAGIFTTLTFKTTFNMYPPFNSAGTLRYSYSRYSENVGIVEESLPFFSNSTNYEVRKLLRYHLN